VPRRNAASERDTVIAAFIKEAPSLTCDERHAEIQRLRRDYGYSALPHERSAELMQLPEPKHEAVEPSDEAEQASADKTVDGRPADEALAA